MVHVAPSVDKPVNYPITILPFKQKYKQNGDNVNMNNNKN